MANFISDVLASRRPLKKVLKDLQAKYELSPSIALAKMINRLESEIARREQKARERTQKSE